MGEKTEVPVPSTYPFNERHIHISMGPKLVIFIFSLYKKRCSQGPLEEVRTWNYFKN